MTSPWRYEQRRGKRQPLTHRAELAALKDGQHLADCVVLDVSVTGARLGLKPGTELPDQFVLILSKTGKVLRRCTVIWRKNNQVGVDFRAAAKK